MRTSILPLVLGAMTLGLLGHAVAAGEGFDPLGVGRQVPRQPALYGPETAPDQPCAGLPDNRPITLAEAVDIALCNNPQTREVWANARYQAAQLGVAESAYLPSLDAKLTRAQKRTSGASDYRQDTGALTLSWLVYDFGGRSATLENARQLLDAAAASQDDKIQSIFLATVQSYYQVQASLAALEAARVSENAAEESYKAADARYRAGMVTPADKLQAQTAWSQAQLTSLQAQGNWKTAQGTLSNVLGRDAHLTPDLATPLHGGLPMNFEKDVASLIATARERRPDLKSAEALVRGAQANAEAVRATGRPSVAFAAIGGRDRIDDAAFTNTSSLGLTLTLPIFSGFNTTYKVQAAEAQVAAKAAQRDRIRLQVAQDVWNAYQNLITASQSLRTTTDLLNSAEASEAMARGRYKAGVGSLLDLLTAQTALASARQQKVLAAYNWNLYRATLAQSMGALDYGFLQATDALPALPSTVNPAGNPRP